MKKITFVLLAYFSTIQLINAQQPMTIAPGLNISAPTAGTSGLKFNNLNSGTTVSTTPTKVLSLDATGNVILGNAAVNFWTFNSARNVVVSPSGGATGIEAFRFVSQDNSTVDSPVFAFTGGSNVFRYSYSGPETDEYALTQETTSAIQRNAVSILWKHYDNSPTPIGTTLFGYSAGTFTVNGFTKLGGAAADVPAVKQKYLTGNFNSNTSQFTTVIAHGLDATKIISVDVIITGYSGSTTTALQFSSGYRGVQNVANFGNEFWNYFDGTNITLERSSTNGQNLPARQYRILITYIQ
jgi:hypothetical protein